MSAFAELATSCVGWEYAHRGRHNPMTRVQAVDCWGLFVYLMEKQGIHVPDPEYTQEWVSSELDFLERYHEYAEPISDQEARVGDAVLMAGNRRCSNHIGVYLGKDRVIHCTMSVGVVITKVSRGKETNRFIGFFRMKPSAD